MLQKLENLLSKSKEEVINTPSLLIDLLRIYSKIYLDSKPCEFCKQFHGRYYDELKKTGLKFLRKMENQKFILKDNIVIHDWTTGKQLSRYNMTDEEAINRLRKYPNTISQFEKYPKDWEKIINPPKNTKAKKQKVILKDKE